jgi:spore germination protein GerM
MSAAKGMVIKMKKVFFVISVLFALLILTSCTNKNDIKPSTKDSKSEETRQPLAIQDYYSYKENTNYVYEGKGNEYASYNVIVDYIAGNRVQIRSNNGGTEMVRVLENKDGELTLLLSRKECYYRENLTQNPSSNGEILLKEPLTKGTSWTLKDQRKRYISNLEVEVNPPSGNYKALEVTTEGKEDKTIDYYAPNIGLVKSVFKSNESEVSSTLSKLEQNSPLTQTVKFFFPNVKEDKIYFINKQLSFKTNDITKMIIEKAYKELPKGDLAKVLGPNVKIKSLYLNKDNIIYVDFTKELVSEMNAGSGYESMILQSITNTLGSYYGVDKVYLTIEGNPYTSGHYEMKKGEFFSVSLKDTIEYH